MSMRNLTALVCLAALAAPALAAASSTLQVRRVTPGGTDVPTGQEVVIGFDRKMVPLGDMTREGGQVPVTITPKLGCQWHWLDVSELACRLPGKRTFRPATHYRIHIDKQFKAMDGATLAHAITREFTTLRPKVTWPHFVTWRSPVVPVYLVRFNLPVTRAQAQRSIYIKMDGGKAVPMHASPYSKQRRGPLLVPVPDAPGAMIAIEHPSPTKPLDANRKAGQPRRQWKMVPAHDLPADADFVLASHGDLTTPLGPLPGTAKKISGAQTGHTFGRFRVRGVRCETAERKTITVTVTDTSASNARCRPGSVRLRFSAPVTRATLAASQWTPALASRAATARQWTNYADYYLEPPRDIALSQVGSSYPLPFTLKAMHDYSVTIPAGVKDQFGRALDKPQTVTFRTGHRRPFFHGPPRRVVLEADEPTIAPVKFTNLDSLDFDYQMLHADALPGTSRNGAGIAWRQTSNLLARTHVHDRQDRIINADMGLRDLLGGRSGVVWGDLYWQPHGFARGRSFFGEVTPYQVFAKVGYVDTLVWVNDFRTGAPVSDATVRLYRGHADALDRLTPQAATTTNADGLAVLPGGKSFGSDWFKRWADDAHDRYIGVTRGGAMGLLPLNGGFSRSVWAASGDAVFADTADPYGHMRTWAVTAQGIYRPGSTVKFDVFARNPDTKTLQAPPKLDYTVQVVDATDTTVYSKKNVHLSEFGDVAGQIHIPKTAPTGWYRIELGWKGPTGKTTRTAGRFLVTEFVPASFKVDAMLEGKRFGAGARVKTQFHAQLHAGGPYSDAAVKLNTHIEAEPFAPDTAPASSFQFDGNPEDAPDSAPVDQSKTKLGHDGRGQAVIKLPEKTGIQYGRVQFQAAVKSSRGTWVAGHAHALYTTRDRFIGLRTDDWLLQAKHGTRVQYLVVDTDGTPQPDAKVKLELQRRQIKQVRVKNAAGDFDSEQHTSWSTEDTCTGASTTAPGSCQLTPQHPGSYRIVGTVTDTHGKTQSSTLRTWATGAGDVLWSQDQAVTLVPDKRSYHAGETAHVLVQNPFPGARALVTVERYGVLWKKVLTLKGSAPVIDVPIGKDFFPGAYLSVTLFSPRASAPASPDLGKPEVGLGYAALKIAPRQSALTVAVKPDAATHKPQQTVHVDVDVQKRHGGAPGRTRLVAIAVDQAVVDLLADRAKYFNPVPVFQAPPDGPDVQNFSLAEQLLSLLKPKAGKGENPGGGGGSASQGPHVRSDIRYGAYWNAALVTDADGKAQFAFKLPDNLTRWRIFVIAMRPGAAMGFGDASVRVNLPIQVQGALPNQVHVGDRFGAGFAVTNRTSDTHAINTIIKAEGDAIAPHPPQHGTLKLGSYDHAIAWTRLRATGPGTITLTGSARAGTLGDALRKSLPVRRAGAGETAAQYGSFTGGKAQVPIKLPDDALTDASQLTVTLSPTLVGNLDGAFRTLRDDPLRTWETRLSRGVLAADYLHLTQYLGDSVKWPDAKRVIGDTLRSAADFQAPGGGMAFWIPRKRFVSPYLSVYTALAFNWLARAGHAVPAAVRSKLDGYLRDTILAGKGDDAATAPVLKAGALAALAPGGHLDKGAVAAMLPKLHQLRLFGQGLLLQAALDLHDTASSKKIVQAILAHGETSGGSLSLNERQTGTYLDILATPLRSNCVVLDALVEARRQGVTAVHLDTTTQKLMRWVIGQRRNAGGWPNSQENVFCTTAITHYADVYERPVKNLSATVSTPQVHDKKLSFAARNTPAQSVGGTIADAQRGTPFDVKLVHGGSGRLYYTVRLDYALPPDSVGATDAGMTVTRDYAVQRGKDWQPIIDSTQLQRGDVVRVTLRVDTPTERHHVVLTDPLPGAFEAVNRQLATAMTTTPDKQEGGGAVLMFDAGPWPNMAVTIGGFYHRETALDAVRFFADDLPAGHYTLVYAAQVISPGTFIAPAPHIKAIYQPDIFGRGTAQHLQVAQPHP